MRETLSAVTMNAGDLSSDWIDLGDMPTAKDLVDPPPSCARFAAIFDARDATVIHEFTKDLAPSGDENGHIHSTVVQLGTSADAVAAVESINDASYAPCAVDTIDRKLGRPDTGPRNATAAPLPITLPVTAAAWRVTAPLQNNPTHDVYYMDIIYMTKGPYLEKLRITRCGCPRDTDAITATELHPGELDSLTAVAQRLAAA